MVAALPLKRISSLRMEFVHALLRQSDQLVGCIGVFAIDDNIERCLHIFEQQSHAMKVDRRSLADQGKAEPKRKARGFRAGAAMCLGIPVQGIDLGGTETDTQERVSLI